MIRKTIMSLAFALAIASPTLLPASQHSRGKTSPNAVQIALNAGTGYYCGRVSYPTYCYGVPVIVQTAGGPQTGTFWYDVYSNSGFLLFMDSGSGAVSRFGTATVTSGGGVTASFNGVTTDTKQAYTGTVALTVTTYKSGGGGGRGGGGAGMYWIVTGGTISIAMQ